MPPKKKTDEPTEVPVPKKNAPSDAYECADAACWNGEAPRTITEALDRIAKHRGPIPA